MNKNLLMRTAVAAVAIPIILWICYQGGLWLWGMVTLFMLAATAEFLIAEGYSSGRTLFWLVILLAIYNALYFGRGEFLGSSIQEFILTITEPLQIIGAITLILLGGSIAFALGKGEPAHSFASISRIFWGMAYLWILYQYVFMVGVAKELVILRGDEPIRVDLHQPSGGDFMLFLLGLLWLGDTAAMFVGKAFGKHKLAPTVSPNKTVEGFIGGVVGAIVVAIILGFWRLDMIPMWQLVVIAILCSVFGQLGDLVESMWKRSLGIKDSSAIIPGHGGVLDRFDSLLFAAPVMYYAIILIVK